jgi:AcrR family transcriptional regulator
MHLPASPAAIELPLLAPAPPERADAARNRQRILCTAERLFAERGVSCVSMDEIAAAAGVGKGTLFRRFGSRAALAMAVLSERESAFQEALIRGAPPLGPGAHPRDRLIAFGEGRLDFLVEHAEILAAAEIGPERFSSAPYEVSRLHLTLLLRQADPGCDAEYLTEAMLAALGADFYVYVGLARELPLERLKAGWAELVRRLLPDPGADCVPGARLPAEEAGTAPAPAGA